jgi:hypothetical protein
VHLLVLIILAAFCAILFRCKCENVDNFGTICFEVNKNVTTDSPTPLDRDNNELEKRYENLSEAYSKLTEYSNQREAYMMEMQNNLTNCELQFERSNTTFNEKMNEANKIYLKNRLETQKFII